MHLNWKRLLLTFETVNSSDDYYVKLVEKGLRKMDQISIGLGSYRVVAIRQHDNKAWLVSEFSGGAKINTYAVTTKALAKEIYGILRNELNGKS